ncbi:hypothetical protein EJ063_03595 [Vibrio aquaticus]|uniref:Outer membrane protein beta-barrel domain-containing protein n=1 Tax=Vibrio aquaticus TaxID=2496559 RepID=A0A3S0PRB1_9VIBR|nr:outer membrane beta-barrel protein [Vibrio aquaticus]RTZ17883.1 hypothetical protein EJ063_03595 [Vibrio aquaticus]
MKKSIITLSIIASTLSGAALAHNGFYVGAAYSKMGYSSLYEDFASFEKKETRNGYAVNAGYDFAFGSFFVLGAEFEYKDLGGVSGTIDPNGLNIASQLDMTSMGINILPKFYIGEQFNIYAKAGLHSFSIDSTTATNIGANSISVASSNSDSSMVWGLGLGYDFTQHISAQTTYEVVDTDTGVISSVNMGMRYKF